MNVRKSIDYSAMVTSLDALMSAGLPQMELYREIGKFVSARPEKGAAVAAAEYLTNTYPDASGFSPRNLRRMREFYRAYENTPKTLTEAMTINWTQNIVILENCETAEERTWYIDAVRRFHWSKAELLRKIMEGTHKNGTPSFYSIESTEDEPFSHNIDTSSATTSKAGLQDKPHMEFSLDFVDKVCYTEENTTSKGSSGDAVAQDSQCYGTEGIGPANGVPSLLLLFRPKLLHRRVQTRSLLVHGGCGRPLGVADGAGPPGRSSLRKALRKGSRAGEPGMVSRLGKLPAQWIRLRHPLRGELGQPPGEACDGCPSAGGSHTFEKPEASGRVRQRRLERVRHGDDQSANADLCYRSLERIVSAYLDLAEERARRHIPMAMEDWAKAGHFPDGR